MSHVRRFHHRGSLTIAAALLAVGASLPSCGGDGEGGAPSGGQGGTAGTAGSAGSGTGGTAGSGMSGSGGTPMAGSGGAPMAGSGGTPMAGSGGTPMAGSGGSGMAGEAGMGGEGGEAGEDPGTGGEGGEAGDGGDGGDGGDTGDAGSGTGGEGGSTGAMCATDDLSFTETSTGQAHDHLPVQGAARTTLLNMINTGAPLTFTMPEDGTNPHTHTLTFTAPQLTTLRNGGALAMDITSSTDGPGGNMHTHSYEIECEP